MLFRTIAFMKSRIGATKETTVPLKESRIAFATLQAGSKRNPRGLRSRLRAKAQETKAALRNELSQQTTQYFFCCKKCCEVERNKYASIESGFSSFFESKRESALLWWFGYTQSNRTLRVWTLQNPNSGIRFSLRRFHRLALLFSACR